MSALTPEQHLKALHYTQGGHWLLLWGTILTTLGYKFGQQVESILGKIQRKHLGKYLLVADPPQ